MKIENVEVKYTGTNQYCVTGYVRGRRHHVWVEPSLVYQNGFPTTAVKDGIVYIRAKAPEDDKGVNVRRADIGSGKNLQFVLALSEATKAGKLFDAADEAEQQRRRTAYFEYLQQVQQGKILRDAPALHRFVAGVHSIQGQVLRNDDIETMRIMLRTMIDEAGELIKAVSLTEEDGAAAEKATGWKP